MLASKRDPVKSRREFLTYVGAISGVALLSACTATMSPIQAEITAPKGEAEATLNNNNSNGSNSSKPTIVLVHGAFADSSSWRAVIPYLKADGYPLLSASIGIHTIAADVDYLTSILRALNRPVILVGHSYGGAVITGAGRDNENVKGLVYIAGYAPDEGENIGELSSRFPGGTLNESVWKVPLADGSNDLYILPDKFQYQFAADVAADKTALMAATQRPLSDISVSEAFVGTPAWKQVPSWFILPELDRNIPFASHRFMAERAKSRETVEIMGASHAVAVSHPKDAAAVILRAATSVMATKAAMAAVG